MAFDVAKEYTNSGASPRFNNLRSAMSHYRLYWPKDWPIDIYVRARRALLNERGYNVGTLPALRRLGASWPNPTLPE